MLLEDLTTPALVVDIDLLRGNLDAMDKVLPGARLRPHVKAHKCTALAALQAKGGHKGFTCATILEVERLAWAGLGDDLLLANEVVDARRLAALDARVTLAVDSEKTIEVAVRDGIKEVVIDVNVGLPRCGCAPEEAGRLAELAQTKGMKVRGVMGYEGHAQPLPTREMRAEVTEQAMARLLMAHADVGGELITAGGTGTFDLNTWATEIQAGSYALMDTAYGKLDLPFRPALSVLATVISTSLSGYAVANCGLKSFGMDHGNPALISGEDVFLVSDEHITFATSKPVAVGGLVRVLPAHIDPTVAYHERMHLVSGSDVIETWEVDMRGW